MKITIFIIGKKVELFFHGREDFYYYEDIFFHELASEKNVPSSNKSPREL